MLRRLLFACCLAFAGTLASCSTVRLSYDNADWLLARVAARYVDLDAEQARAFRARVEDFHAWHRAQELPRYAALFDEAARRLERGLRPDDVEWVMQALHERARVLGRQAGADFAPAVATLNEVQLRRLESRFEKDNREFFGKQVAGERAVLDERRAEWLAEQFEDWLGALDERQRALVDRLVMAFPDMPRMRLEERKRRQQAFLGIARQGRAGLPDMEARLAALLGDLRAGRAVSVQATMQRWEEAFAGLLLELDGSLSVEQRRRAVDRMRAYAADFRVLAGAPAATRSAALALPSGQ